MTRSKPYGPGLRALQESFWSALVTGNVGSSALREVIASDERASASERLGIYAGMYRVRLLDALAEDFPKLLTVLGPDAFSALMQRYLFAHPSVSPTLRDLGRRLPEFLAADQVCAGRPWLSDLVALEWARLDVFDRVDQPVQTVSDVAAHAESEFRTLDLHAIAAHALVQVAHAVVPLWSAIERDGPDSGSVEVAVAVGVMLVWRKPDGRVYHRAVDALEAACVARLLRGVPFVTLCALAAETLEPTAAAPRMVEMLAEWARAGLLRRLSDGLSEADSCGVTTDRPE